MITRRTKVQLLVFVIITLLGVTYVGARYARLDRLVRDTGYTVVVHLQQSGGIFAGGEVTYRGVGIGQVSKMELTDSGVDAYLTVENDYNKIPADSLALVGNRSAVGEQYIELQPQSNSAPYLADDSDIAMADTATPIATEKLLGDISSTVQSVNRPALRTTVKELGTAFDGTGEDLQRLIDTGNSFIKAADDNFDVTTALIRDSNTVLKTQVASEGSIRNFSKKLSLFSTTLAASDPDIRRLLDTGSAATVQLRALIEENRIDLGELVSELVTTGNIVVRHLDGIKQALVVYPYVVEGAFTVVAKTPETGLYDAHFGAILTSSPICTNGYDLSEQRPPQNTRDLPMDEDVKCTDPPTKSNARGAQNTPRAAADYRSPVLASYDTDTGKLTWGDKVDPQLADAGSVAPQTLGKDSWKWLYLRPLMGAQR